MSDEEYMEDSLDSSNIYKKVHQATANGDFDESVIDESEIDESVIDKTKSRHSEVHQFRRKKVQRIDSDSESESDEVTKSDNSKYDISQQSLPQESDSGSESDEVINSDRQSSHYNTKDISQDRTKQPRYSEEAPLPTNSIKFTEDVDVGRARMSQLFKFDNNDILNSTDIHTLERNKQPWRPSIAIKDISENSDDSIEILSDNSDDIVELSSNDIIESPEPSPKPTTMPRKPLTAAKQQTLHTFVQRDPAPKIPSKPIEHALKSVVKQEKSTVSREDYQIQKAVVESLQTEYFKLQDMKEKVDFTVLPDKGVVLIDRLRKSETKYLQEKQKLESMKVDMNQVEEVEKAPSAFPHVNWEDIQEGANAVQPKTFGKQAMSTYNAQKALTMDRLQQLHGAIRTCPKDDDIEEDPKSLKIPLMPHQRRALAWLLFREKEKPSGGILADDMGLGKTLTMIALILRSAELEEDKDDNNENDQFMGRNSKFNGGSLIVCPASLINQWSGEIERRLKRGSLSFNLYHGPRRESSPKKLADYDVVITTYAIVNNESDKRSCLYKIKWKRIILDEAHQIRNPKAQTSEACCQLSAKSRWALTGTPMHNKELDMYALLKFLRCTPFDDLQVWKRWVGDKSQGGQERLHTVISSLMLRRTKIELMEKGALNCMPEKKWELVKVELDKKELAVYQKILIFSQTLFAQFLHQRAEKRQDYYDANFKQPDKAPNEEYYKVREKLLKMNKVKEVSQHEILVLLLRLRQICCHPSLITAMLNEDLDDIGEGDEESEEMNLLEQLNQLKIDDEAAENEEDVFPSEGQMPGVAEEVKVGLKEAARGHLRPSDPVFAKERASSKVLKMLEVLKEKVLETEDKAIIVSQWSSYLHLIALQMEILGVKFDQLDGKVPVNKRMAIVDRFNDHNDPMKVLLLSLTAGGVGLNLVGGNHLFLLDLHWNPQLENQAQDRIYRMGQKKSVFVYKFMAVDTIEERIKLLQDKKLAMAEGILTGTRQVIQSKLSMDDLKLIFGM